MPARIRASSCGVGVSVPSLSFGIVSLFPRSRSAKADYPDQVITLCIYHGMKLQVDIANRNPSWFNMATIHEFQRTIPIK